jgi:pimeloyl-ACP methyl ester carboxylesterase
LGQSESCSKPRHAETIARELHAALLAAGVQPPYILVGHSAGGLFVRVFAGLFPDAVAGVLLLDPAPEDAYPRAAREHPELFRRLDQADSLDRIKATPGERAEDDAWETSLAQARASDATLRAPVVLLSSPRQDLGVISDLFREEQRRWTDRQARATFRVVSRAGHAIQRDRPDTVVAVIRSLQARP